MSDNMTGLKVGNEPACTERLYIITQADLPLSCPTKEMEVWNAHPRVFLPIAETGKVRCPYCSAEYILKDFNDA